MLEDETFENFLLSPLKRRGEGVHKIVEKIRYLRRDAFVDYPLLESDEDLGQLEDDNNSDALISNIMMMITLFQLQLMFSSLELARMLSESNLLYRKRDQNVKKHQPYSVS